MAKRPLTEDEKRLWEMATGADKKLRTRKKIPSPPAGEGGTRSVTGEGAIVSPRIPPPNPPPQGGRVNTSLTPGSYANIDRNTADRFRKGARPIDAALDLHGMTREKAWHALGSFIESHYKRGSRCLLIVTGKGKSPDGQSRGILRELVPQWLDDERLRPMILALDTAKPQHGGSGAYYVLLKRKRV